MTKQKKWRKRWFVGVTPSNRPMWVSCGLSPAAAWNDAVVFHTGSIYGRRDYVKKRNRMRKAGWRVVRISAVRR